MPTTRASARCSPPRWRWRTSAARPPAAGRGRHRRPPEQAGRRRSASRANGSTSRRQTIFDLPNSAIALAVNELVRERNKVSSAPAPAPRCSPARSARPTWCTGPTTPGPTATASGARSSGRAARVVLHHRRLRLRPRPREAGGRRGEASGGRVLGAVRHPIGTNDFSSLLLQAQASGADVVALRQCRRRHRQFDEAGGRVRPRQEAKLVGAHLRHERRAGARPRRRAGPSGDRCRSTGT